MDTYTKGISTWVKRIKLARTFSYPISRFSKVNLKMTSVLVPVNSTTLRLILSLLRNMMRIKRWENAPLFSRIMRLLSANIKMGKKMVQEPTLSKIPAKFLKGNGTQENAMVKQN